MFHVWDLAWQCFNEILPLGFTIAGSKDSRLAARGLDGGNPNFKVHNGALVFFAIFGFIGFVVVALIQYTAKLLLTLVVVEEPAPLYLPVEDYESSADGNDAARFRQGGDNRDFITSSIRGALRYLQKKAGPYAPWRGLGANIIFVIANIFLRIIFAIILQFFSIPRILASFVGGIASMIVVSRFALAVTHIMISMPLPEKPWYKRVLETPWSSAVKTIPALFIFSTCLQIVSLLSNTASNSHLHIWARVALFFAFSVGYITLVIPALIVLVRVQASTLPDEIRTIVPFDRTFGQDISLTNDALTVKGSLKSLNWPVMRRTLIFLAKAVPVVLGITGSYIILMVFMWLHLVVDRST